MGRKCRKCSVRSMNFLLIFFTTATYRKIEEKRVEIGTSGDVKQTFFFGLRNMSETRGRIQQ